MLINDPNHNFSDFSKNTHENKGLFGVLTMFESSVSHVSHYDFALQIESKESMQSGNRFLERERKERKGKERKGKERKGKERKGKERKGKERKGKERKGKERKGKEKERKGKERKGKERKGKERKGKERKGKERKERKGKEAGLGRPGPWEVADEGPSGGDLNTSLPTHRAHTILAHPGTYPSNTHSRSRLKLFRSSRPKSVVAKVGR